MYEALDAYMYDCLEYGLDYERFHCSSDNRHVRGRVFSIISDHLAEIGVHSLVAEKRKTEPTLTRDGRLYSEMLSCLLSRVVSRPANSKLSEVTVIADVVPLRSRRRAIEKSVRSALSTTLPKRPIFRVLHHDSRAHYGLQVADYLCWAVVRKYERGESGFFDQVRPAMLRRGRVLRKWDDASHLARVQKERPPRLLRFRREPLGLLSSGGNLWRQFTTAWATSRWSSARGGLEDDLAHLPVDVV